MPANNTSRLWGLIYGLAFSAVVIAAWLLIAIVGG